MKLIDYTGKLNTHKEYIKILNKLSDKCKYIEVVVLDLKESDELVDKFKNEVVSVKKVNSWWASETIGVNLANNLYRLKSSKELFEYLYKFETFCKYYEYGTNKKSLEYGDYSEKTDFGVDDIAFLDDKNNYLLYTNTHEGFITISKYLVEN